MDETIVAPNSPGPAVSKQPTANMSASAAGPNFPMGALLSSAMAAAADKEDDNAQSILEEHVSRIWDSSNGQTPSRSPGRHSPDRMDHSIRYPAPPGPSPNVSGTNLGVSHASHLAPPKGLSHNRRKGEKDPAPAGAQLSTASFDSGMGEDRSGVYYHEPENNRHKHVYHYHHHHHHIPKDSKGRTVLEHQAQSRSMQYYINPALRNHSDSFNTSGTSHGHTGHARDEPTSRGHSSRDRDTRKSSAKKVSDTSSNFDSGVSLAWDQTAIPNLHDPANEK